MKPLSARTRRTYLFVLVAIFLAAIVPLALYAAGWRFASSEGFVRTGGVYLHVSSVGVNAYVNGELAETSSLLQRNIFVQNLAPASYEFSVEKEGFRSWKKTLAIRSQKVTEAHPLLVPEHPERISIPELLVAATTTAAGTKSAAVPNPEYAAAALLFAPAPAPAKKTVATTTPAQNPLEKTAGKLTLAPEGDTVIALWGGSAESAPFYFCTTGTCVGTTTVSFTEPVRYVDFYPGDSDFIVVTLPSGVYVAELDTRSGSAVIPLSDVRGAEFRVDESGALLLKEGKEFVEVVL